VFVELKAPGKSLRPLQIKRKEQLESLGFKVYIIDSYEKVDVFIQEVVG
jgi:Uma2 family endonuclease